MSSSEVHAAAVHTLYERRSDSDGCLLTPEPDFAPANVRAQFVISKETEQTKPVQERGTTTKGVVVGAVEPACGSTLTAIAAVRVKSTLV